MNIICSRKNLLNLNDVKKPTRFGFFLRNEFWNFGLGFHIFQHAMRPSYLLRRMRGRPITNHLRRLRRHPRYQLRTCTAQAQMEIQPNNMEQNSENVTKLVVSFNWQKKKTSVFFEKLIKECLIIIGACTCFEQHTFLYE